MKIKITSNFNDFKKNLKKKIDKIIEKEERVLRNQNQAFILDKESESLLYQLLKSQKPFPSSLSAMFFKENGDPLDYDEDKNLRAIIHHLVDNGLITVTWGDGLPIFGRIEQKGKSYFEMKQNYFQMFNQGENMQFKILDKESEQTLKELLENKEFYNNACFIVPNKYSPTVIENLINLGYLYSKKGVVYFLGGEGFVCGARLTQAAKTYDEMKKEYAKNSANKIYNNYGTHNDFSGSSIENSTLMVGNSNSEQNIKITNELVDEIIKEINEKIDTYGLTADEKQELKDLVEDVKEKQQKKPNLIKRALKSLWDFAKDVGCNVLAAYISGKCGF